MVKVGVGADSFCFATKNKTMRRRSIGSFLCFFATGALCALRFAPGAWCEDSDVVGAAQKRNGRVGLVEYARNVNQRLWTVAELVCDGGDCAVWVEAKSWRR